MRFWITQGKLHPGYEMTIVGGYRRGRRRAATSMLS